MPIASTSCALVKEEIAIAIAIDANTTGNRFPRPNMSTKICCDMARNAKSPAKTNAVATAYPTHKRVVMAVP